MTTPAPSATELRAWAEGRLVDAQAETIALWVEAHTEEAEAALAQLPEATAVLLPAPPSLGQDFAGDVGRDRFCCRRELGRGGMGVVEAVEDRALGRSVALKRCRPRAPDEAASDHAERLALFRREARIAARLEHPAIITVHDVGADRHGAPAILMQQLEGEPFDAWLRSLSPGRRGQVAVVRVLARAAEAVAFAHSRGVVHRDLKPENLWLGPYGAVTILDWGVAATADEPDPFQRAVVGTPGWMAPEQAADAVADPRMDVWALGGLLLYGLKGLPPRQLGSGTTRTRLRQAEDLDDGRLSGLPSGLTALLRHCLAHDPGQRYGDGGEVAAELNRWLEEGFTHAQQPGPLRRLWGTARRHPVWAGVTATALLAILVGLGIHWAARVRMNIREAERAADIMAGLPMGDRGALANALERIVEAKRRTGRQPALIETRLRLEAALRALDERDAATAERDGLRAILADWQHRGPDPELIPRLEAALVRLGAPRPDHPLRNELLPALALLASLHALADAADELTRVADLLRNDQDPAWSTLGAQLAASRRRASLLVRPLDDQAIDLIGSNPLAAETALACFLPDEGLLALARQRMRHEPGAFWPRVVASRAALADGSSERAEGHALVALGADQDSVWPRLLLAQSALVRKDPQAAAFWARRARHNAPQLDEPRFILAATSAATGDLATARDLFDPQHDGRALAQILHEDANHPLATVRSMLQDAGLWLHPEK